MPQEWKSSVPDDDTLGRKAREARKLEEPTAARSAPRPLQWHELEDAELPERDWIIPDWLSNGVTLLAGAGGAGKSYVAQGLGSGLSLGAYYIGQPSAPKKVLIWNCEDDHDEIWRRQAALAKHFDVKLSEFCDKLHITSRVGCDNVLLTTAFGQPMWTNAYTELQAEIEKIAADVVILDNVGHLYACNENIRGEVTKFVNGMYALTERPIAVILSAHPAKAKGSEWSGSTAWENAARMRWFLGPTLPDQQPVAGDDDDRDTDDTIRYLSKRKANYTAKDFIRLRWVENAIIPDAALGAELHRASNVYRHEAARRLIIAALRKFNDAGLRCVAGHTSKDAYLIGRMQRQRMVEDLTKKELSRALEELMMEGKVVERESGRGSGRNPLKGLYLNF